MASLGVWHQILHGHGAVHDLGDVVRLGESLGFDGLLSVADRRELMVLVPHRLLQEEVCGIRKVFLLVTVQPSVEGGDLGGERLAHIELGLAGLALSAPLDRSLGRVEPPSLASTPLVHFDRGVGGRSRRVGRECTFTDFLEGIFALLSENLLLLLAEPQLTALVHPAVLNQRRARTPLHRHVGWGPLHRLWLDMLLLLLLLGCGRALR